MRTRTPRGAIYTACLAGLILPFFLALSDTILQAALSFYNQQRINFVANDAIEHFDTIEQLDSRSFDPLFLKLAQVNGLRLKNIKSEINSATIINTAISEEAVQIKISGCCQNALGLFSWYRPFNAVYTVKLSQFETLGFGAINAYPFCEPDAARGLSAYLPIYRSSPTLPTWAFTQDNAIGSVRKFTTAPNAIDDSKSSNWYQVAPDLLSIY